MEKVTEILGQALPWILIVVLLFFTLIVASNVYGIFKAKKADPTLRLSLNNLGKVVMGLLYGGYILILIYTVIIEVQILTNTVASSADKMTAALNATNLLTIVTFIAAIEFQDIFFIGDKNLFIAGRMYEIRRMRRASFPKKHTLAFIYGQKQYDFSTRFVDVSELKPKLKK